MNYKSITVKGTTDTFWIILDDDSELTYHFGLDKILALWKGGQELEVVNDSEAEKEIKEVAKRAVRDLLC